MEKVGLLLVGCGKMGGALLRGWLDRGFDPGGIQVVEADPEKHSGPRSRGVAVHADAAAVARDARPEVVVLAVKPQSFAAVVPAYRHLVGEGTVFLSIAAGQTLSGIERLLDGSPAVVRAMPNTPAAIARGITVGCANRRVSSGQKILCQRLLEAVGEFEWVADEALMDAVTAVSGSGPAYVFLLAECLAEAGAAAGLPEGVARRLARATVAGAGELLRRSEESAETLRQNVTSPGGTTAAALAVLMAPGGLASLMNSAVAAATRRSRELAGR